MKPIYILVAAALFVSCNSGQKQTSEQADAEFDKQKEEQVIRQLVDDVYKEVNVRWDKSSDGTEFEGTMEDKYTTEEWQKVYLDLRAIEAKKVAAGNPDGTYFSENGNVWTMGSLDLPFTTEVVRVEFADAQTADVYFWLKPAEDKSLPILWKMKKVGDSWLIQNFIEGDENYSEYDYNYMEHMKAYINENQ